MQKVATDLLNPWAIIPPTRAKIVEALKKVNPADSHFMSVTRWLVRRLARELRDASGKEFVEDLGAQVKLGRILVLSDG